MARALASLVFIRAGWFPLIVKREDRSRYIEALEQADRGDLRHLVAPFVEAQRSALIQATEIAFEVRPIESTHDAIVATRERLAQRGRLLPKEWAGAKQTAKRLVGFAKDRFEALARELDAEIGSLGKGFGFDVREYKYDGILSLPYQHLPDFDAYSRIVQLFLNAGRSDSLLVLFYGIGPRYRGLIGVSAYMNIQDALPVQTIGGAFQINYEEDVAAARTRFAEWLDRVIVEGLNAWRLTL